MLETGELLFLPFIQLGQYFGQGGGGLRALPTIASGVVFPVIMPHGQPSVLKWLDPPHYGGRHYFDYRISGLGEHPYLAQELANLRGCQLWRFFKGALVNSGRPLRTGSGSTTSSI